MRLPINENFIPSQAKIKFKDQLNLRNQIEQLGQELSQIKLTSWALAVATRVQPFLENELPAEPTIANGIASLKNGKLVKPLFMNYAKLALRSMKLPRKHNSLLQLPPHVL